MTTPALGVERAGLERLDELEPLWLALHRHHREVATVPVVADDRVSWQRRRAWYERMLVEGSAFALLACRGEATVGYAMVQVHAGPDDTWPVGPRYGEVVSLAVLADARGAGVGSALLDAVDAALVEIGVHDLMISVMAGNDDARRLYERRGLRVAEHVLFRFGEGA